LEDFNLVRNAKEKSNERVNTNLALLFNDCVNKWILMEFKPSNRLYTWTNNQADPILVALDKVFANTGWEQHYPLSTVQAMSRAVSDHTPFVIDTGHVSLLPPKLFRFEKWWLNQPDLASLVNLVWTAPCPCRKPIDIWQYKIRQLRTKIKGGALTLRLSRKNQEGVNA
jgi:hypothetical protein